MEFTLYNLAKEVAEKALNEITYEGKTLREWVEIIVKQQPCEDCISREEAKNLFLDGTEGYDCRGFTRMEIGEMLDELPSVKPQQTRWIPVSERLPEDNTLVLVTVKVGNREPKVRSGYYYMNGHFHIDNGDSWESSDKELLAWKPLSEPYKAESESKE